MLIDVPSAIQIMFICVMLHSRWLCISSTYYGECTICWLCNMATAITPFVCCIKKKWVVTPEWYVCFNSSQWYFIIACILSIFPMLSMILRCVLMNFKVWFIEMRMRHDFMGMFMRLRKDICFASLMMCKGFHVMFLWGMKVIWCWKHVYESESKMIL
jgi:hypothetical protein